MTTVDIVTARQQLDQLAEQADAGEEVIITRPDGSAFKLVPLPTGMPKFGSAAGLIHMSDNFDEPLGKIGHIGSCSGTATVQEDGAVIIEDVPFAPGTNVKITITEIGSDSKDFSPYSLHGTPFRYDDPTEPVAVEDWETNI